MKDWFYTRDENSDNITIIFKPYSMYALLAVLLVIMAVSFVPALAAFEPYANFLLPIAALIVLARIILMHKVNREIQQAMKADKVTISGGKLSKSRPLTFIITKHEESTPS
uniref:hypothetical protein n=1 Tax=Ningiella ruwaisensis TaxID=2364274 RepID=UPI00109FE725|nr:hypothetical protein [Ningiella ruwaisensis]